MGLVIIDIIKRHPSSCVDKEDICITICPLVCDDIFKYTFVEIAICAVFIGPSPGSKGEDGLPRVKTAELGKELIISGTDIGISDLERKVICSSLEEYMGRRVIPAEVPVGSIVVIGIVIV